MTTAERVAISDLPQIELPTDGGLIPITVAGVTYYVTVDDLRSASGLANLQTSNLVAQGGTGTIQGSTWTFGLSSLLEFSTGSNIAIRQSGWLGWSAGTTGEANTGAFRVTPAWTLYSRDSADSADTKILGLIDNGDTTVDLLIAAPISGDQVLRDDLFGYGGAEFEGTVIVHDPGAYIDSELQPRARQYTASIADAGTFTAQESSPGTSTRVEIVWRVRIGDGQHDLAAVYNVDGSDVVTIVDQKTILDAPTGYTIEAVTDGSLLEVDITNNSGSASGEVAVYAKAEIEATA